MPDFKNLQDLPNAEKFKHDAHLVISLLFLVEGRSAGAHATNSSHSLAAISAIIVLGISEKLTREHPNQSMH